MAHQVKKTVIPPPKKPGIPVPPSSQYMKTDSIRFDTSSAPWMKIAREQLKAKVREHGDYGSFTRMMYESVVATELKSLLPENSKLLEGSKLLADPVPQRKFELLPPGRLKLDLAPLKSALHKQMGKELEKRNPEINKYLQEVKTDPLHPESRGKSWPIEKTSLDKHGDWQVTAWCAAFVNWCLKQSGAPYMGYATAASWLRFGTPLPAPVYGCITVIAPSSDTGSTTGHVAFFVRKKGHKIVLLGGNQHDRAENVDKVSEIERPESVVRGYRWPTTINYFLLDSEVVV